MKPIIVIKQIHSCFATVSSNDVFLYRRIKKLSELKGEKLEEKFGDNFIQIIYLEEDETFSNKGLYSSFPLTDYSNTIEFKELVNSYLKSKNGWTTIKPTSLSNYYRREKIKEHSQRVKKGYIFPSYKRNRPLNEFQGGFSITLFKNEKLQDYLKSGGAFGYIGHYVRKKNLDRHIEKKFLSLKPKIKVDLIPLLVAWLTSTDGRHFGDSLEDYSLAKQKAKINNHIKQMFNLAYLWTKEEHRGTLASTNELREKYKKDLL